VVTATEVFELFIPASLRAIHLPGGGDDLVRRSCPPASEREPERLS
jgi:hypothetical protein